jgi:hypothetical protein
VNPLWRREVAHAPRTAPFGLNLKGVATTERLEASSSFNSMVSHRVRVGRKSDVDQELIEWLRQAYEAA